MRTLSPLLLLLFFSLSLSFPLPLLSIEGPRKELLQIIDEELTEIIRLDRQQRHRDPNLLLRMAELHLEKARLYKENENQRYLRLPPKQRRRQGKSKARYFQKSQKYFQKSQQNLSQNTQAL